MFESIAVHLREAPLLGGLLAFMVVMWIVNPLLLVLFVVRRSRLKRAPDARLSPLPELGGLVMLVAPVLLAAIGYREAAALVAEPHPGMDPSEMATLFAQGISTEISVSSFAAMTCVINALMLAVVLAALVTQRLRTARPPIPAFVAVAVGLGGLSVVALSIGVVARVAGISRAFGAVASADPPQRAELFVVGLEQARAPLEVGVVVALVLLGFGVVMAVVALARSRLEVAPAPGSVAVVALALAGSAALIVEVAPFAAENDMPLPETVAMSVFPLDMQVALPELEGPLRHVPRGPAVQIELERLMIEGMVTKDLADLGGKLAEMRRVDELIHPGQDNSVLLLVADQGVRGSRLLEILELGRKEGFKLEVALEAAGAPAIDVRSADSFAALAARSLKAAGQEGLVRWDRAE